MKTRRRSSDVRRQLRLIKRPITDSALAEGMLQCYEEMSETGRAGVEQLVASMCNQFAGQFGEMQALELVGALLQGDYLKSWEGGWKWK